jgi:hypothetical protein
MDETTYRLLEIAGSWLAGIGSLLAVVVALHLARIEKAVRLAITAGHRLIITPGVGQDAEVVEISVANVGSRPVVITNVQWKMGVVKRQYAVQVITGWDLDSLRIHGELKPGHRGAFYIVLDPNDPTNWIRRFAKNAPRRFGWLWARRLRIGISTAVGKTIWAPIERNLQEKLSEAADNFPNSRGKYNRAP